MSLPSDKETSSARPVEVLSPVNTAFPNSKVGSSPPRSVRERSQTRRVGDMLSANVTTFNRHKTRKRPKIVEEYRHAMEQIELQSQYPGRPPAPEGLPQSEYSPWPRVDDDTE